MEEEKKLEDKCFGELSLIYCVCKYGLVGSRQSHAPILIITQEKSKEFIYLLCTLYIVHLLS